LWCLNEVILDNSITAELLAGARALSLADRHHFEINLSYLLDKSIQYKRNWLLNVVAALVAFSFKEFLFSSFSLPFGPYFPYSFSCRKTRKHDSEHFPCFPAPAEA